MSDSGTVNVVLYNGANAPRIIPLTGEASDEGSARVIASAEMSTGRWGREGVATGVQTMMYGGRVEWFVFVDQSDE